jgi:hypothetical protein
VFIGRVLLWADSSAVANTAELLCWALGAPFLCFSIWFWDATLDLK